MNDARTKIEIELPEIVASKLKKYAGEVGLSLNTVTVDILYLGLQTLILSQQENSGKSGVN